MVVVADDHSTPTSTSSFSSGANALMPSKEDKDDPSDSRLLLRSLASRLKSGGVEDAPLTTKALRDLEKAKKEKVYARTIVRVRFPDRVCLQGFFHPRETVDDLYLWVSSCLEQSPVTTNDGPSSHTVHTDNGFEGGPNRLRGATAAKIVDIGKRPIEFELYSTPPHRVQSQNRYFIKLYLLLTSFH